MKVSEVIAHFFGGPLDGSVRRLPWPPPPIYSLPIEYEMEINFKVPSFQEAMNALRRPMVAHYRRNLIRTPRIDYEFMA